MIYRRIFVHALIFPAALLITGCQRTVDDLPKGLIMQKYQMKSYPIGRFLIDIPEKAIFEGVSVRFDGMSIRVSKQKEKNIAALAKQRIASLSSTKPSENKFVDSFLSDDGTQSIILYTDTPGYKGGGKIESHLLVGANGPLLETTDAYGEDKKQTAIKFTREVLDLIKPVNNESTAKNFVADGYQIGTTDPKFGEKVGAVFILNETIIIAFTTHVMVPSTEAGLIERTKSTLKDTQLANTVQVLRMNKRNVASFEGEEVIYKNLKGSPEAITHNFEWQFKGRNQIAAPAMKLSMELRGDSINPAAMSDEDALSLWDTVLRSVQVRPGAN